MRWWDYYRQVAPTLFSPFQAGHCEVSWSCFTVCRLIGLWMLICESFTAKIRSVTNFAIVVYPYFIVCSRGWIRCRPQCCLFRRPYRHPCANILGWVKSSARLPKKFFSCTNLFRNNNNYFSKYSPPFSTVFQCHRSASIRILWNYLCRSIGRWFVCVFPLLAVLPDRSSERYLHLCLIFSSCSLGPFTIVALTLECVHLFLSEIVCSVLTTIKGRAQRERERYAWRLSLVE